MKKIILAGPMFFCLRMRDILGQSGFEFLEASTNDEAWTIHSAENVDLILSKEGIAGMGIRELCQKVRSDHKLNRVSVVLVCDLDSDDTIDHEGLKVNGIVSLESDEKELATTLKEYTKVPLRYQYRTVTQIRVDGYNSNAPLSCMIENISTTGLLLQTDNDLQEGIGLSISFFLPKSKRIMTNGQIVRVIHGKKGDGVLYGVRFDGIDVKMQRDIEQFVESRC